jgi:hypothetical protein
LRTSAGHDPDNGRLQPSGSRKMKRSEGELAIQRGSIAPHTCIRYVLRGPNHDAVIRIGGEAPRRRAHSPCGVHTMRYGGWSPPRIVFGARLHLLRQAPIGLFGHLVVYATAGRKEMPSGISPVITIRHSAMSSLRASATIMVLRVPLRPSADRSRYHLVLVV